MDKNQLAVDLFDKYANQYQDKFMDVSLYHATLDLFCQQVARPAAQVLDLACGPGNITKYLFNKRPDFQIMGVDLSPQMIALAQANNTGAQFQLSDCRALLTLGQNYDGIICGFGLPYLSKAESEQLIRDAGQVLAAQGCLYLSTMEGDYNQSGFKGPSSGGEEVLYQYYHEADYLIAALEENGFKLIDLQRIASTDAKGQSITDLIILAKKTT